MSSTGFFYGMGVGPGEPGLISVVAWEQLKTCDIIYVPKARTAAESVAKQCLPTSEIPAHKFREIEFTMDNDRAVLRDHYSSLATSIAADLQTGRDVAYLTLGDAMTYSTYTYTLAALLDCVPHLRYRTFPGITSFCALAAATGFSLGEGKERILILPCPDQMENLRDEIIAHDLVVLMKVGARLSSVLSLLKQMDIQDHCVFGRNIGMKDEVISRQLHDLPTLDFTGYLSTLLIRKSPVVKRHQENL